MENLIYLLLLKDLLKNQKKYIGNVYVNVTMKQ